MEEDRRTSQRIPVDIPMIQFIDNQPIMSVISNLSASGFHACHIVEPMSRSSRLIQVELPLPGVKEALWVKGEVVYVGRGPKLYVQKFKRRKNYRRRTGFRAEIFKVEITGFEEA